MNAPVFLWRVEITVPAVARLAVEETLEARCVAVASFEVEEGIRWSVEGFTDAEPDRLAFTKDMGRALRAAGCDGTDATPTFDLVPQRDWLADNLNAFPPVRVGRYFIHGSHYEAVVPAGSHAILLDPGTAFGSGEHASTAGCLEVLDGLAKGHRFQRPLDMGCGSGILAIAMAKTWRQSVVATDIDPESARVTRLNARRNGVGGLVHPVCAPGYRAPEVAGAGPYDLIVANILARPLIAMAGDLARHLRPARDGGGWVVLSGLLARDGNWVAAAHRAHGLTLRRRIVRQGWMTLVLSR